MKATIVICTRNRCRDLHQTLCSLQSIAIPDGLVLETVVVDNGSSDDTKTVVMKANAKGSNVGYLYEPRPGKSQALNSGLAASDGDLILSTDDDVRFAPDWLVRLMQVLVVDSVDAVAGAVRLAPHLLRDWMTPTHQAWLASTHYLASAEPPMLVGANMAFWRRLLRTIPEFDVNLGPGCLGLWEDTLFSLQLQRAGFKVRYVSDAIVEHHFQPSRLLRTSFLRHALAQGRSSGYVSWHWYHEKYPHALRDRLHYLFRLYGKRMLHWRTCRKPEGIPVWELDLVSALAALRQYALEAQHPPRYPHNSA